MRRMRSVYAPRRAAIGDKRQSQPERHSMNGHGCVAFLPPTSRGQKAASRSLSRRVDHSRRPRSQTPIGSRSPAERCRRPDRRYGVDDKELGARSYRAGDPARSVYHRTSRIRANPTRKKHAPSSQELPVDSWVFAREGGSAPRS